MSQVKTTYIISEVTLEDKADNLVLRNKFIGIIEESFGILDGTVIEAEFCGFDHRFLGA